MYGQRHGPAAGEEGGMTGEGGCAGGDAGLGVFVRAEGARGGLSLPCRSLAASARVRLFNSDLQLRVGRESLASSAGLRRCSVESRCF